LYNKVVFLLEVEISRKGNPEDETDIKH